MKDGKSLTSQGPQDPRDGTVMSSLWSLFVSHIPNLEPKTQQPRNTNRHKQQKPQQNHDLSPKERGHLAYRNLADNNHSTLTNTTEKNCEPIPLTSGKAKWRAWTSTLLRLEQNTPMPLSGQGQRSPSREPKPSSLTNRKRLTPTTVSVGPCKKPGFYPYSAVTKSPPVRCQQRLGIGLGIIPPPANMRWHHPFPLPEQYQRKPVKMEGLNKIQSI